MSALRHHHHFGDGARGRVFLLFTIINNISVCPPSEVLIFFRVGRGGLRMGGSSAIA